jgi:uncharacterized OsmC-like protein
MELAATITSTLNQHNVVVRTNEVTQSIPIAPKPSGYGSSVNGGELLLLALATCFCNDLYREASKRGITVSGVTVECTATFGREGEPGSGFKYKVNVVADAPREVINGLIAHTDHVAEIHNTLRKGVNIELEL